MSTERSGGLPTPGKVIFLNGASSSGKTTLALELQNLLPEPFLYFSVDHFGDCDILPGARINSGEFEWSEMREKVFLAFHLTIVAMANSGCNVIVEHIIETEGWRARLEALFAGFDLYLVALVCPVEELNRREIARGDRPIGDAERDARTCLSFCRHDIEFNSTGPASEIAMTLIQAWQNRDVESLSRFEPSAKAVELEGELTGKVRPRQIPDNWLGEALPDGKGWRWWDPNNHGNCVRMYRGDPNAESAVDRNAYVVVTSNGELIDRNGKPMGKFLND
ncbi:MAG TPA: hypothetical protein VK171_04610 [Fimbriimonas sp.]|nr:hypothetical protein [Fimbriimonas sp.]